MRKHIFIYYTGDGPIYYSSLRKVLKASKEIDNAQEHVVRPTFMTSGTANYEFASGNNIAKVVLL